MRIANLSTFAARGGAARATYRLHREFLRLGADSTLYFARDGVAGDNSTLCLAGDKWARLRRGAADYLEHASLGLHRPAGDNFHSNAWRHFGSRSLAPVYTADIVCLYWIAGLLTPEQIADFPAPVVWRLSDCWPFTGGCHYPGTCRRFTTECGRCPVIGSDRERDVSRRNYRRKARAYRRKPLTIVAPSQWIAREARASTLFRDCDIRAIATGVDTDIFRPGPKPHLRAQLGLPADAFVILAGAQNPVGDKRKGLPIILEALGKAAPNIPPQTCLAVLGTRNAVPNSPVPVYPLGSLGDDLSLAIAYGAADIFISASREDNLPNTILEAMSCGVPVVGFRVGGIPEAVIHGESGWLVPPDDIGQLAAAIVNARHANLAEFGYRARRLMERSHNLHLQAQSYLHLFSDLTVEYRSSRSGS